MPSRETQMKIDDAREPILFLKMYARHAVDMDRQASNARDYIDAGNPEMAAMYANAAAHHAKQVLSYLERKSA